MDAENDLARLTKAWMLNAAALFGQHPRLGVIGMAAQQSARGFAFTADAGAGPWLVRRDAMIEVLAAAALGWHDRLLLLFGEKVRC